MISVIIAAIAHRTQCARRTVRCPRFESKADHVNHRESQWLSSISAAIFWHANENEE